MGGNANLKGKFWIATQVSASKSSKLALCGKELVSVLHLLSMGGNAFHFMKQPPSGIFWLS